MKTPKEYKDILRYIEIRLKDYRTSKEDNSDIHYGKKVAKDYEVIKTVKELIDKETPMKPVYQDEYDYVGNCPVCNSSHIYDYEYDREYKRCSDCGQTIEWPEKEVKFERQEKDKSS